MNNKPLTYFITISVVAHAALFGLWDTPPQKVSSQQESSIEIGLVTLPKITRNFSTEKSPTQSTSRSEPASQATVATKAATRAQAQPEKAETTPLEKDIRPAEAELALQTPERTSQPISVTPATASHDSPAVAVDAAPITAVNPAPTYPADALRYGWEGEVWLIVDVSRSGEASNVKVDKSSGYPVLDRAASRTVRKWQFEPARVGTEAVEGSVRIPVRFKIKRT